MAKHKSTDTDLIDLDSPEESKESETKVSFDNWYALRNKAIPAIHHREILVADFKGQKVPMVATMEEFDAALKKYGVEL